MSQKKNVVNFHQATSPLLQRCPQCRQLWFVMKRPHQVTHICKTCGCHFEIAEVEESRHQAATLLPPRAA